MTSRRAVTWIQLLILAVVPGALIAANLRTTSDTAEQNLMTAKERSVLLGINRIRKQNGLSELKMNSALTELARNQSGDLAATGIFSHTNSSGQNLRARLSGTPFERSFAGENLQKNNYPDPVTAAIDGWVHSPGHFRNILDGRFTETGIGVARDDQGYLVFTQIFLAR